MRFQLVMSVKVFNEKKEEIKRQTFMSGVVAIWHRFGENASLHGCKNVYQQKSRSLSLAWLCLIMLLSGLSIKFLSNLYVAYYSYPFITKTMISRHFSLPLPVVIICPLAPFSSPTFLKEHGDYSDYVFSQSSLARYFNLSEVPPAGSIGALPQSSMFATSVKPDDIFLHGYVKGKAINVSAEIQLVPFFGTHCFRYNAPKTNGDEDVVMVNGKDALKLIINLKQDQSVPGIGAAGAKVILYNPLEAFPVNYQSLTVGPGTATEILLTTSKYTFLPAPYKSFGNEPCTDEESTASTNPYNLCLANCFNSIAVTKCKCSMTPTDKSDTPECTFGEWSTCIYPTLYQAYTEIVSGNSSVCECQPPCKFSQYAIRSSVAAFPTQNELNYFLRKGVINSTEEIKSNFLQVVIRHDSMMVRHVMHVPELTFSCILSKLGGYMGCFLGASLLTMVELAQTLLETVLLFLSWMKRGFLTQTDVLITSK